MSWGEISGLLAILSGFFLAVPTVSATITLCKIPRGSDGNELPIVTRAKKALRKIADDAPRKHSYSVLLGVFLLAMAAITFMLSIFNVSNVNVSNANATSYSQCSAPLHYCPPYRS